MESGAIPNSHITASTEQTGYEAWRGRLNNGKAWQTNTADTDQWLQIDLGSHKVITGIQTQGLWGYHIKSYKLMFSDDASTWVTYGDGQDDTIFDGNSDGTTMVEQTLPTPVTTRYVRINPQIMTGRLIRMRVELLGCNVQPYNLEMFLWCDIRDSRKLPPSLPLHAVARQSHATAEYRLVERPVPLNTSVLLNGSPGNDSIPYCTPSSPLGMESGAIPNSHITASTEQTGYEAWRGRLNNGKAWQTNTADTDQWLQIDLGSHKVITGIQTQGLWGYHIKSYKLMFSDDASTWVTYGDGQDDTIFDGNSDGTTMVEQTLPTPVTTRYVRINPQIMTGRLIRMRVELLGCNETGKTKDKFQGVTLGMLDEFERLLQLNIYVYSLQPNEEETDEGNDYFAELVRRPPSRHKDTMYLNLY
ncbi:F5 [Branchiostoma lanceolatum]|uniref:F5 protein n=1 Tax=Branchiostoma lanceolatum TaxID=7740 RepID=A0A8S4MLV3_BRALA|nr:F5 [Branchiostoma lanceolatum]